MKPSKFWIGTEPHHTTAYMKRTLFVSGEPNTNEIVDKAKTHNASNIVLGFGDAFELVTDYYKTVAEQLINSSYTVSFQYPIEQHAKVANYFGSLFNSRSLIPIAFAGELDVSGTNKNLTIKIGDSSANGTWNIGYQAIQDSNRFTETREFDEIAEINDEVAAPKTVPVASVVTPVADTAQQPATVSEPVVTEQAVIEAVTPPTPEQVAEAVAETSVDTPAETPAEETTAEAASEVATTTKKKRGGTDA